MSELDKDQVKHYSRYCNLFERVLNDSNTEMSTWEIIPADDLSSAKIHLVKKIITRLEKELKVDSAKELSLLAKGGELLP